MSSQPEQRLITLGRVSGCYGVAGWLRISSDTEPTDNILNYKNWRLKTNNFSQDYQLEKGRVHGNGLIARLKTIDNREQAQSLVGAVIAVPYSDLEQLPDDKYYWIDLIGLAVETLNGQQLGLVDSLFATGANDVLVVKGERERLIPWIDTAIIAVDVNQKKIRVDWDPQF